MHTLHICEHATYSVMLSHNRDKEVRVFLCGDYAFICIVYGLSGASGEAAVE